MMNFPKMKSIDAVVRNLSIIGEAVRNIPKEIKAKNSDVAWNEIKGMRNKVVHEYFGIDEEILWKTIQDKTIFQFSKNKLPNFCAISNKRKVGNFRYADTLYEIVRQPIKF